MDAYLERSRAMRLIFVTGSLSPGGAERQTLALMNRLAERGHVCHAVSVKRPGSLVVPLRGGGTLKCLYAARYLDLRAVRDLAAHVRAIRPSAVVAANGYALMYAWLGLRLSRQRVPLVATYHSNRLLNAKERLQMLLYRLFFRTADCSVFVCHRQRRYWKSRGVFSRRNEVIYNGVNTDEFRDTLTPQDRLELRGLLALMLLKAIDRARVSRCGLELRAIDDHGNRSEVERIAATGDGSRRRERR